MKTRLLLPVYLLLLLLLPTVSYAQGMEPEEVIRAFYEAANVGDVETSMAFFAEDAYYDLIPPPPGLTYPLIGKEAIRARREALAASNAMVVYEIVQVDGNNVTVLSQFVDDGLAEMDIDYLEATVEYVIEDGKIKSFIWTATDESMVKLGIPVDQGPDETATPQTQMTDPEAIYRAAYDAFNAGDVDGAMTYFAEDIVGVLFPPPPGGDTAITGKDLFRQSMEGAVAINMQWALSHFRVDGETATYKVSLEADDFMADLGVYPLAFTGFIVVRDGLIVSEVWSMDESSRLKIAQTMAQEATKDVVRRYMEAWDIADLESLDEILATDFTNHSPPLPADRDGMMQAAADEHIGFPNNVWTIEHIMAEGEMVAVHLRFVGVHEGEFFGVPATGAEVNFTGTLIFRVQAGQITDRWGGADMVSFLTPLGFELVPPTE